MAGDETIPIARRFAVLPDMKKSETRENSWSFYDLGFGDRIALLLDWCKRSGDDTFIEIAIELTTNPSRRFDPWSDGQKLVSLMTELEESAEYGSLRGADKLRAAIEDKLVAMLDGYIFPDDLDNILDSIEGNEHAIGARVVEAVNDAMRFQFERVPASST
ncbi:hypothetical protein [Bradyrhizobium sp. Ash2021]|uniref:hypothetical protein n=1 Tax=Bradyrhizobium sp. Ash2021 TaxID=2954771 RepID=UPI002814A9E0|nr:hypothetical protein [Bradyrhizobium sp. Ash2021]WMT79511.1 hypothetical protein NL528_46540 [Bradyrhizobium sp. Ash2021]